MSRARRVVIVGGGAAGTLVAIHMAAYGRGAVSVVEPAERLGEGIAYGTTSPSHLLNVRANGMSAFPDRPTHFTDWARAAGTEVTGTEVRGTEFLPRMLYARYLRDTLAAAGGDRGGVSHVRSRAVGLAADDGGARLVLSDGSEVAADDLVLATGNGQAPVGWLPDLPGVIRDAWAPGALEEVGPDASVAIVGSGLSAIDVVLSLRDRGHRGPATLVSSHGLLPEPHAARVLAARPHAIDPANVTGAGRLVRALRADAAAAEDWRQTIDGVRPVTVATWRALSIEEQRRALRHGFRRWEVRRHRMAPEVAAVVEAWRADGRLRVVRGRVVGVDERDGRLAMTVDSAGARMVADVDVVVACVGPSADPLHDPLLRDAIRGGVLARHPLGLGLDVDQAGRARRPDGTNHPHVWTVGSLRKGAEWESTAVPELRLHAAAIAAAIDREA
ncbi:MAG: FAD/NAD(P)-binding protein [Candidatus Limnocylindrales bacterium]